MYTKLFTVGPAQMYQNTLDVRKNVVPYFRTAEFSALMKENKKMMQSLLGADDDFEVIFLTASGSGAMEAAVINCFDIKDKLLIISGGTFGERFEKICEIHNIPFTAIKLNQDEQLTAEHLSMYASKGYTGLLINHHETYTGQLYDLNMVSDFCKQNNLYLMVDAISSFLCDPYNVSQYNVDATIVSSQKGLCLAPGLSIITLSKRIVKDKVLNIDPKSLYFNFKDYITNISRGQTPFTPAVGVCFELNDMLKFILKRGVHARLQEVKMRCEYFRNKVMELPVSVPTFPLSNSITPVRFKEDIAMELFQYLKNEKGIIVNPVGGELGKYSIRVAHIGDLKNADYDMLINEMKTFLRCGWDDVLCR